MNREQIGSATVDTYDSLDEWIAVAEKNRDKTPHGRSGAGNGAWAGATLTSAIRMCRDGWQEGLAEATPITESALATIEREMELPVFQAVYLMAGSEVDVGRFLGGVPENMIEYDEMVVSTVGHVVTLCASVSASAAVSTSAILRRGAAVVGLATALERCGHAVEIYASMDVCENYDRSGRNLGQIGTVRVLVKGAHDQIDSARIAYALAHPSMLRQLGFAACHDLPAQLQRTLGVGTRYGVPCDPIRNLPDGTIYLPCLLSDHDVPEPELFIADTLRDLGLVS